MFEYINMGVVLLSGIIFLLFTISYMIEVNEKDVDGEVKKGSKLTIFTIIVSLIAPFAFSAMTKSDIYENIQLFKDNKVLKCSTTFNNYLVSSKSGWNISDDSFLKDSLLIRADKCDLHE
ncbi:hypothetical protein KKC15_06610 [bacterium]|nr:hypothetical protein [bacterium]